MLICLFFSSECNHHIHLIEYILILHLKYYIIYVVSFFKVNKLQLQLMNILYILKFLLFPYCTIAPSEIFSEMLSTTRLI